MARRLFFVVLLGLGAVLFWESAQLEGKTAIAAEASGEADPEALLREGRQLVEATEPGRGFELLEKALQGFRDQADIQGQIHALRALAYALKESHARDRGLERLEEAYSLALEHDLPALEAEVLTALARTRLPLGQISEAWSDLENAEEIYGRLKDSLGIAKAASARSSLSVHTGAFREAIRSGRDAIPPLEEAGALDAVLVALSSVAYSHHKLGEYKDALEGYERVLELGWRKNDQRMLNFAFCNRAEIRWLQGKRRPALEDLRRAIDGFEAARERVPGTSEQRAEFLARQVEAYERLIRFLGDTYQGLQAFEVAERFHGRSFLELLEDSALPSPRTGRENRRREELVEHLGRARLSLEESASATQTRTVRARIRDLEKRLEDAEAEALGRGRHFRRLTAPPSPTLEEVQAALDPEEVLVAYWVASDRILAWVIDAGKSSVAQIPVSRRQLEEEARSYLEVLRSPELAEDAALARSEALHLARGRVLHRWLIDSLPKRVHRFQRWIVIPDGILHYLPFESLVADCEEVQPSPSSRLHAPYQDCRYLGLEKALSYVPSAGVLLALRDRQRERLTSGRERQELLALAPAFDPAVVSEEAEARGLRDQGPLLFAKQEVERISALFDEGVAPLVDQKATEKHLKDLAGRYRMLHFATHGLVSDDLPMSSGLLLTAGDGEDGLLQAHEVLGLDLSADLVTLSGCRTGRGGLRRGEGIVGLSRSFLTAGASSVVVSLWDVDDRSTPVLMEAFYRGMAEGMSPAEALLKARRTLFEASDERSIVFRSRPISYAHPRFWAPFILVGGGGS